MKVGNVSILKRFLSFQKIKPKICIVGGGPAGFYAAQHLAKKLEQSESEIDIYERLPVPFGLVRFGVAPDHPEVKNVINTFSKTAENPCVRFLGNVNLGSDVSLAHLKNAYHIVLLTYGAEQGRKLDIPGENKKNVIEARKIVGWYNGIPWDSNLEIDLSGETAAIFGQGNVAIDVARVLLTPVDQLKKTDITQHALEVISRSKVKTIHLIGRRGPLQAAFTIKELREMLKLENCRTEWQPKDFEGISDCVPKLARPKKRITELMIKSVSEQKNSACDGNTFKPVFHRSPLEILGKTKVEEVIVGINKLEGDDILNKKSLLTKDRETIKCDLAIPSIGYKSIQADKDIPFNFDRGVVKNTNGKIETGVYVSGWLGTGPTGVILTTMSNAFGVADLILHDVQAEKLINENKGGHEEIMELLHKNNVQVVTWKDWQKIDKYEEEEGRKVGKPREKIVSIEKMLQIAAT
ncbi:NADPH:adrenodoxin oxidoreductase, mitochondrial [Anoplophora glabripennis]|uniref:NADPH:adrenodoxin oxidoreductase, mitochondrial n=1 Tax=Anoplophora glabripennis TaxID=217634 RepID=UPI0008744F77|nr:NADPH:adrenodoxin oxidoreductase, mitochondrial [Anoplophora glabripennis]